MNPMTDKRYRKPLRRSDGLWVVSDLYCAAFLVASGNEPISVEATFQDRRYAFVIAPEPHFEHDCEAWTSNSPIRVRDFLDAVYQLKGMIRSAGG